MGRFFQTMVRQKFGCCALCKLLVSLKPARTAPKLLEQSAEQKNSAVKLFSEENNKHKNITEVLKLSQVPSWVIEI